MTETPGFDFDELFDEDYLHFYGRYIDDETNDNEAELVVALCDIEEGDEVLDVSCGHGRISNRVADVGAHVIGIDRSAFFLERARADAAERGVEVEFRELDVRQLDYEARFDVAVSWFTSFGYFDDDTNRDVLKRIFRALAPGGRFLIETINRDLGKLSDEEQPFVKEVGGEFMIDQSRFDPLEGRIVVRRFVTRSNQPIRSMEYFIRVFTFTELRGWLHDAGFVNVRGFGGEGEVYRVDSARLVVVAQKP